jgi:SAM-dependent methyltransferase
MVAPHAGPRLLTAFGEVLRQAGLDAPVVEDARRLRRYLNPEDALPAALHASYTSDPLAPVVSLLVLGDRVAPADAQRALAPLALEDLIEAGLLDPDGDALRSPFRVATHDGLLLLGDGGGQQARDHVSALTGPSMLTSWLTPRDQRRSMLDLGTGSGVQALLAARHCEHVIGVDVNPQALGFARLNAQLNGAENVEWRSGSWLEPVASERFDLIVTNPPYVISPDSELTYRDSGMAPGELVAQLCHEIPAHLEDGGVAVILCQWPHASEEDWDEAPRAWTHSSGCDVVAVRFKTSDPLDHAVGWNAPPVRALAPAEFKRTVARWYRYCAQTGTGAISFGAIVLRRREHGTPWSRIVPAVAPGEGAARQLARVFAGNDLVDGGDGDLMDGRYALPDGLAVAQRFVRRASGWVERLATISVPGELGVSAAIDPAALELVFRCDGIVPLRELIDSGAGRDLARSAARELLVNGLLGLS